MVLRETYFLVPRVHIDQSKGDWKYIIVMITAKWGGFVHVEKPAYLLTIATDFEIGSILDDISLKINNCAKNMSHTHPL